MTTCKNFCFYVLVLVFFQIGSVSSLFSQEHFALIETAKDFPDEKLKNVFPIIDSTNGNLALILQTKKGLESYLYSDDKARINHISLKKLPSKMDVLVGSANVNTDYRLFFTNTSETKFGMVTLNFETGSYTITENLQLKISDEKFIKYISHKNKLFLLTIKKQSSILKLYTFNMDGNITSSTYDLSNEIIENDTGLAYNLSSFIYQYAGNQKAIDFIDASVPNSLETSAAITKIYYQDNDIILTNNQHAKFTYKITISPEKDTYSFDKIENSHFEKVHKLSSTNSFILDDYLIVTHANSDAVFMDIYNRNTLELKKTYTISKKEPINFKNSPIIIENSNFTTAREVEKTSKFVRKVAYSNLAISGYKINNKYIVTLGASEPVNSGGLVVVGYFVGGIVAVAVISAFEAYSETKSTRIVSVFDTNFNHLEGAVPRNGFDQIQDFLNENRFKTIDKQTIFKFQDTYIWGGYNWHTKHYRLYKFLNKDN